MRGAIMPPNIQSVHSTIDGSAAVIDNLALPPALLIPMLSVRKVMVVVVVMMTMTMPPLPVVPPIALPLDLPHSVLAVSPDVFG